MSEAARIHFRNAQGRRYRMETAFRWSALITGGALALLGLSRRSRSGIAIAAAGGLLSYAGARAGTRQRELIARSSILLNCTSEEAYQFWSKFENLPLFMRHLESVTLMDQTRSRWIAIGPLGKRVTWDAEIAFDRKNDVIAWRSLPDSEIYVDGIVKFRNAPANRGTVITVVVIYQPPAGAIGNALSKLLGKDPSFMMRQDLRRLKALIETGEIPTVEGQSHGPRSGVAAAARIMNPDEPIRGDSKLTEVLEARRRAS
ncbi:MAG TPA: SRPBCC family protein [Candidatus Dormibacteraeota bacterium]|nr:SRPBCC family protein [Candidatus Dormibacteraeota bacterium]